MGSFKERLQKFKLFLGRRVWNLFLVSIGIGVAWFLVDLSFVYVVQACLVSLGLAQPAQTTLPTFLLQDPLWGLGALVAFGLFRSALLGLRFYITGMLSQEFMYFQRQRVLELSFTSGANHPTAELVDLFSERTAAAGIVINHMGQTILTCMALFLFACMGFFFAPMEFAIGLFLFGLAAWPLRSLSKHIHHAGQGVFKEWKSSLELLLIGLRNRFLIKIYAMNEAQVSSGKKILTRSHDHFRRYFVVSAIKSGYPLFVGSLIIALLMGLGLFYFHTAGVRLIAIFYIFLRMAQLSSDASTYTSDLQLHWKSLMALYKATLPAQGIEASARKKISPIETIDIRNLSFAYAGNEPVLSGLEFSIRRGDRLLIKGASGKGKSTLIGLLCGLMQPTQGEVFYNNQSGQKVIPDGATIGYMGPDPFMIPGTLRENLTYGLPESLASQDEIWRLLEEMQCLDFVQELPGGLETYLSEDTPLSTGQKQRLALVKALLRRPSLLVLDEATANLDHATEEKIKLSLMKYSKEMIFVLVSHKENFDQYATQIVTL